MYCIGKANIFNILKRCLGRIHPPDLKKIPISFKVKCSIAKYIFSTCILLRFFQFNRELFRRSPIMCVLAKKTA